MAVAQFRELQDAIDELVREQQNTTTRFLAQLIRSKEIEPGESPHPHAGLVWRKFCPTPPSKTR